MRNIRKLSIVAMGALLLIGCSAPDINDIHQNDNRDIKEVKTSYSNKLKEVNNMVAVFYGVPINVYVEKITDSTASAGKLPKNISTIVQSSFNSIGGNVVTMAGINTKNLPKGPVFVIKGAITEFDLIEASGQGIDAAAQGTSHDQKGTMDGGMDRENKITKLAITFNPVDIRSGNFVSMATTKNKITIKQKSSGNEFAISILGTGFGLDNALTKAHGIHSSINILVELSVIEVLGKLTSFPYWILTGGSVNRDIVSTLSSRFVRDKLTKKIQKVSYLLQLRGARVGITSMMNDELKKAIRKYKSTHGMNPDDVINNELYMSLIGAR